MKHNVICLGCGKKIGYAKDNNLILTEQVENPKEYTKRFEDGKDFLEVKGENKKYLIGSYCEDCSSLLSDERYKMSTMNIRFKNLSKYTNCTTTSEKAKVIKRVINRIKKEASLTKALNLSRNA